MRRYAPLGPLCGSSPLQPLAVELYASVRRLPNSDSLSSLLHHVRCGGALRHLGKPPPPHTSSRGTSLMPSPRHGAGSQCPQQLRVELAKTATLEAYRVGESGACLSPPPLSGIHRPGCCRGPATRCTHPFCRPPPQSSARATWATNCTLCSVGRCGPPHHHRHPFSVAWRRLMHTDTTSSTHALVRCCTRVVRLSCDTRALKVFSSAAGQSAPAGSGLRPWFHLQASTLHSWSTFAAPPTARLPYTTTQPATAIQKPHTLERAVDHSASAELAPFFFFSCMFVLRRAAVGVLSS
jgi:hypothetical protein